MDKRIRICDWCGAEFGVRYPSDANRFCSRSCAMRSRAGTKHPHYKGGGISVDGYRLVSINGKLHREHRLVMEQHLQRQLECGEVVHHLDGDRLNNALANLALLPSQSEHMRLHARDRTGWAKDYEQCVECGTTERPHGGYGLCEYCYNKWRESHSWQGHYSRCTVCGSADRTEAVKGVCSLCYQRMKRPQTYEWSRNYPCCVECGTTERNHEAKGECTRCYWRRTAREKRVK